jgi:hypothetical protein
MDMHLFLMFATLGIVLIESILSSNWYPPYFRKGFKVFSREAELIKNIDVTEQVVESLNKGFKSSGYSPTLHFKILDSNTIAFREKIFEFTFFSYTPIMHGKIELNQNHGKTTVIGLSNWFPIAFGILWYSSILSGFSLQRDFVFFIAPIVIFGIIYFMQSSKYNKVIDHLSNSIEHN